ncbi:MAG TPA: pyrrolo-quinoline quinone [Planctomycetaceae bacterium]|nr:pyrrolo-quinoline quinone [Planctomycetaceae bacterium]
MLNRRLFLTQAIAGAGCAASGSVLADQSSSWLGWRGLGRDGYAGQGDWPGSLSAEKLQLLWERPLDSGYSGPLLSGQQVFVTETKEKSDEVVWALDAQTGQVQWQKRWSGALSVPFFAKSNGDWIRSTPFCDGSRLYVGGMRDVLVSLDCQPGQEAWRFDFPAMFGSELPSFGFVCSPLVDSGTIYVQAGGGLAAIDSQSGQIRWRGLDDGGGMWGSAFSSPIMVSLHGRRQLLVQTRTHLVGVDPENGSKIWEQKVEAFRGMNILTPAVWNDCVFTSSYGGKSLLFEFEPSESGPWIVKTRWQNKTQGYMSSPIIIGDTLYLHLRNRRLVCLNLQTGQENWTTKPFGEYWSMVTNGQQILALDERGELLLVQHNPKEFQLLDQREISQQSSWAHLALAGDMLLIRHLAGIQAYRWSAS